MKMYAMHVDMGVRGFDLGDRGGRSEPTSPERRERAGTPITANEDDNVWHSLPKSS